MGLSNNKVVVTFTGLEGYPEEVPFDPPERYPDYQGWSINPRNQVYRWVRETLFLLGLDQENFNTPQWNPLGQIIEPGMTVLIKPNTVLHRHLAGKNVFSLIIHASVLRPVLDYVCLALKGRGRIIIGDAQQIFGLFDVAMAVSQVAPLLEWYRRQTSIPIECMDFRQCRGTRSWLYGQWSRKPVQGDPRGYQVVNLGDESLFREVDPKKLRISVESHKKLYQHHSNGRHEYVFPRSVLISDVIINIPKMKTHRRTAVSLALKNLLGFPAAKECMPHFRIGSVQEGGDQYIYPSWRKRVCTRLQDEIQSNPFTVVKFGCAAARTLLWSSRWLVPFKDNIDEAMWYGNDTLWRLVLDINRAALYSDKGGQLHETPQRRYFCLIDGIVAGEKDGPLSPDPVTPGVLVAGLNPVAIDAVAATLMGFDINKIPFLQKGLLSTEGSMPLFWGTRDGIRVVDGESELTLADYATRRNLRFEPHPNWKGHVERPA